MANYNPPVNAFKPGNRLYRKAVRTGRLRKFKTPTLLWQEACSYFEYCATSPIPTLCLRGGKAQTIYRIRPMSIRDLCLHLKVAHLDNYKKMPEYTPVVTRIRYVIYEYNYTRAAAGFLKGRIISRTLRKEKKTQPALLQKQKTSIEHINTYSPPKTRHFSSPRPLVNICITNSAFQRNARFYTYLPPKTPHSNENHRTCYVET